MKIRISGQGTDGDKHYITIDGLTKEEQEYFEGMVNGCHWLTVNKKGLHVLPTKKQLPSPVEDEDMMPYWSPQGEGGSIQTELFCLRKDWPPFSPSFVIQHLCGYNYSPEHYKRTAEILESFGFECLRSRRGRDGKFWEIWFLPGLFLAEGEFKKEMDSLKSKSDKTILDRAIGFLCSRVSFGTLDVVAQRAAMVLD